jgi:hypothetical protein
MSKHGELDTVIEEYVGVDDDGRVCDPTLYEQLISECSRHLSNEIPFEMLTPYAQHCITEWESMMKFNNTINQDERYARF